LIAAVAFAVKTTSKCSGSALKKANVLSRIESTIWPDSCEGSDVECGFPYRLEIIFLENPSIKDFAYTVEPAWSRYVFPVRHHQSAPVCEEAHISFTFHHRILDIPKIIDAFIVGHGTS
jgi:hypothetical protein